MGWIGSLVALLAVSAVEPPCAVTAAQLQRWGDETLATIQRDFWLADRGQYAERTARSGESDRQPAFMWGCGVQLSALAAAARVDPDKYRERLVTYVDRLQEYWFIKAGLGGYDVQPKRDQSDRYYDDNAWIVLALVETYRITGDRKHLERAVETQRFVMSGEDDRLGGGLYWRENVRGSKNTCANAPAIVGALLLHQQTGSASQLEDARRLYAWTCAHLRDPDDGLFWDAQRLGGEVDKRKYTYNTAVMIRANCLLYEITREREFLEEAERMVRAAVKHWVNVDTGAVRDAGHFAHMLIESMAAVSQLTGDPEWRRQACRTATYVHRLRSEDGRYPKRWHRMRRRRRGTILLDQASVARMYFALASVEGVSVEGVHGPVKAGTEAKCSTN